MAIGAPDRFIPRRLPRSLFLLRLPDNFVRKIEESGILFLMRDQAGLTGWRPSIPQQ
jgi:hypothetical protein